MAVFVNINLASGADDGSSWANSYRGPTALQKALGTNPSSTDEIWVASGTYVPSQRWDFETGVIGADVRTESFKIPSGARVYGGFAGNETAIDQRDVEVNPTILTGNLDNNPANNAYHVVFFYQVSDGTLLDGFTITAGNANGGDLSNWGGGGVFNYGIGGISNPTITNCHFLDNVGIGYGGAVFSYVENGNVAAVFQGCSFSNNSAEIFGGAVAIFSIDANASSVFENCVFLNNSAQQGGAVLNLVTEGISDLILDKCVFSKNSAAQQGGAIANFQGSINCANCVFSQNEAFGLAGGAIVTSGYAQFMNVTFFNNSANTGAIIYSFGSEESPLGSTITNSILWDDTGTTTSLIENDLLATTTINYSDVIGGYPGIGNIDLDPLFINPSDPIGPDMVWMTNDDGLALQPCSPCVNAGTAAGAPSTDITGNDRPSPPSMGAYEVPNFTIEPATSKVICDINSGSLTVPNTNNVSLLWQSSIDGGVTWQDTTNTSSIFDFVNSAVDTDYRVRITTQDCIEPIFSSSASIIVEDCIPPAPSPIIPIVSGPTESIEITKVYDWAISSNTTSINVNFE